MSTDPRIEAVAKVMNEDGWTCEYHEPESYGVCHACWTAQEATAQGILDAVDAYDAEHPRLPDNPWTGLFVWQRDTEAALRERIAQDIEARCIAEEDSWNDGGARDIACDRCRDAAHIARGVSS